MHQFFFLCLFNACKHTNIFIYKFKDEHVLRGATDAQHQASVYNGQLDERTNGQRNLTGRSLHFVCLQNIRNPLTTVFCLIVCEHGKYLKLSPFLLRACQSFERCLELQYGLRSRVYKNKENGDAEPCCKCDRKCCSCYGQF